MRILIPLLLVLAFPTSSLATAQASDILILEGKKRSIDVNPLDPFLAANPGLLPKSEVISTGNWRGYIATWEVKDDQLLLVDVEILVVVDSPDEEGLQTEHRSVFSEMFPGRDSLPADWFTGYLIVPTGKLARYVHLGYASTYKKYQIATVRGGTVTQIRKVKRKEFEQFRLEQFAAFKRTEEYGEILRSALERPDQTESEAEEFLFLVLTGRYLSILFDHPS